MLDAISTQLSHARGISFELPVEQIDAWGRKFPELLAAVQASKEQLESRQLAQPIPAANSNSNGSGLSFFSDVRSASSVEKSRNSLVDKSITKRKLSFGGSPT